MTSGLLVRILFVKEGRIPFLSSNELGAKSRATFIPGHVVNKPQSNFYWLTISGKCLSLIKI